MMTLKEIKPTGPNYHKPIEELIEDLGHAEPANQIGDVIITVEDLTDALHYLQTYQRIEDEYEELKDWWAEEHVENVALSWDELKQMEGKPVWVETSDSFNRRRWMFVGEWFDDDEMRLFDIGNDYPDYVSKNGYESGTWQAYQKERE